MKPKIARAYVKTEAEKAAMVKATGLRSNHVFCGEDEGDHIRDPQWKLRPGELIGVFDLTAFGDNRTEMAAGVATVQAQGADVCEVETGAVAGTGVAMLQRALSKLHGAPRIKTKEQAVAMAKAAHKARTAGRMKQAEAKKIWRNLRTYPRWQDAIAKMPGWNKNAAYKILGGRGAPAGRPPKPKQ